MIIKELAIVVDTYTNKNGEEKKVWRNIGAIHATNDGREYIVLDPLVNLAAIPRKVGDSRVFVSIFEPKVKQAASKPADQPSATASAFDDIKDDIPW